MPQWIFFTSAAYRGMMIWVMRDQKDGDEDGVVGSGREV